MRRWTPEERKQQAKLIQGWKPWEQSTGAKTKEGKDTAKMNALKHGLRSKEWQKLKQVLKSQKNVVSKIQKNFL